MVDPTAKTTLLVQLVERIQTGDRRARDELLRAFQTRLEHLARKMVQRYPNVGRWVEVEDVLQNSLLRLLRALESVQPKSTRDFFGLAAKQMRRELLDLSRHFYGPLGEGANLASLANEAGKSHPGLEARHVEFDNDLDQWCEFHKEVEKLPPREREIVGLIYYHGWTQAEVAELFRVNVRTIRRWWESALVELHRVLKGTEEEDAS
jgi:RNA polymerase sigma-70 factor (ECF subfamily)